MKKVTIKKVSDSSTLQIANFENDVTMNEWIEMLAETKAWGSPEINEEVLNENGEITTNSTPAEYEVLIEDCTAEVEQERINKEAKEYLVKTDYVVLKFAEALAKGESIEGLKLKYETVLLNRASVRDQIV